MGERRYTGNQGTTPPYGVVYAPTPARGTRSQIFECRGGVRLDDGRFGDAVDLHKARFSMTRQDELSLRRIVTPELRFNAERPEEGRVVLNGAKVVTLIDLSTSWPGPGVWRWAVSSTRTSCPYGHFPLSRRLEWVLAATPEYVPEPYERLATVMRSCGEERGRARGAAGQAAPPSETLPPAAKALGVPPGLDGGVRLPAGAGGGVDGGAVGGGHGGLRRTPRPGRRATASRRSGIRPSTRWTCCCR
ncbi:hypothetical protein SGLAM104S_02285 [Streptomyces glaucescens]